MYVTVMILVFALSFVVLAQDETKEAQIVLTNNNVCVNNVQSSCVLILSSYLDNCLVDTCFINIEGDEDVEYSFSEFVDFTHSYEEVDTVKAFFLSCVNRLQPVCESKSVEIREPEVLVFTLLEDDTYSVKAGKDIVGYETVEIPEMYNSKPVTQISERGFYNKDNLKSVTIPNSITKIGAYAFAYCDLLNDITFPKSINFIGKYAFYNSGITNAYFEATSWWLENDVPLYAPGYIFDTMNLVTYKSYTNGFYYVSRLDLSKPNQAAQALKGVFNIPIYIQNSVFADYVTSSRYCATNQVAFYTENWVKR